MTDRLSPYKRYLRLAAGTLVAACLVLVGVQMFRYAPDLSRTLSQKGMVPLLAASSVAYAVAFGLLALAWHLLLTRVFGAMARFGTAYSLYARTSIAKYLPGNVGHVVGRQVLGKARSIPQGPIAGASVMEIVSLTCVAGLIFLWMDLPVTSQVPTWAYFVVSFCLLLAAPLGVILYGRRKTPEAMAGRSFVRLYGWLCAVCLLDLSFFLATGGLLYGLAAGASIELHLSWPSVAAVYAVSWFLGLVTPGAPAGAGVREAVIIGLLSLSAEHSQALAVAVLFRIMTTAGDVIFFATGYLPWLNRPPQAHNSEK